VDTPRRARASIGKRIDHNIAPVGEFPETIRAGARHLSFGNQLDALVTPLEKLTRTFKKAVRVGFIVVEQTDASVVQALVFPPSQSRSLDRSRRRRRHDGYQLSFHAMASRGGGFD
jgi:hypothetical protein